MWMLERDTVRQDLRGVVALRGFATSGADIGAERPGQLPRRCQNGASGVAGDDITGERASIPPPKSSRAWFGGVEVLPRSSLHCTGTAGEGGGERNEEIFRVV